MNGDVLVSVVTPSFDQARFIGRTLQSVAGQTYPHVEHIVIDGQSTDGSADLVRAYAARNPGRVQGVSEPDGGQADAINKGLRLAKGSILAYLNSDDTYESDAIARVVAFFRLHPDVHFVHGRGLHIDADDAPLDAYPSQPCDRRSLFENCHICQPTAFWRREVTLKVGAFDPALRFALDYDYWIRVSASYDLGFLDAHLANTRLHRDAKTVHQRHQMHREILGVVKRHYGTVSDHWIYAYAHSFPSIDRLRRGGVFGLGGYLLAFPVLAAGLFLRHNHRIPLRSVRLFVESLRQPRGSLRPSPR